ncbi:unnamed protein product [Polarella glacialis]|uniref:Uncharacterized protein n=1 Tax=Polarella glacialis TaxID=89957 RepID=A0A813IP85_POLGL|nr:unnamed protein product [Polarella glacialis]
MLFQNGRGLGGISATCMYNFLTLVRVLRALQTSAMTITKSSLLMLCQITGLTLQVPIHWRMEACGEGQTATTSDATTSVAIRETAASTDRAFYTVPPDLPANMRVGHPLLPNHLSALFELPPHYFRGSQAGGGSTQLTVLLAI